MPSSNITQCRAVTPVVVPEKLEQAVTTSSTRRLDFDGDNKDQPFFASLKDCGVRLDDVAFFRLSRHRSLRQVVTAQNVRSQHVREILCGKHRLQIQTVGDLCRMSPSQISKLPLHKPVDTLREVLSSFAQVRVLHKHTALCLSR